MPGFSFTDAQNHFIPMHIHEQVLGLNEELEFQLNFGYLKVTLAESFD